MIDTLQNEGFAINDRELIRLRLRLKLLLRESVPRPKRKTISEGEAQNKHKTVKKAKEKKARVVSGRGLISQISNSILADEPSSEESDEEEEVIVTLEDVQDSPAPLLQTAVSESDTTPLSNEEALRKQLRLEQLQKESDEKWQARKRRRRTRGWAGLPPDTPGEPPRFPSETTIDEAKAYLRLDNTMYRELRERFLQICKEEDIIKKTISGPEKWAHSVQKLISENDHLANVFQEEPEALQGTEALFRPKGQKALSIDVICMDVTKRLRTMDSRMTLGEAKNILSLNPEHTRHVRSVFAAKLRADHFTNKLEAGEQHWADLKTAWVNECERLSRVLSQGAADPEYNRKLKAVEVIARDVMKRLQQENSAKDPTKKKQVHQGPGPGPAPPVMIPQPAIRRPRNQQDSNNSPPNTTQSDHSNLIALAESADLQIDPSLLLAASDAAVLPTTNYEAPQPYQNHPEYQHQQTYQSAQHAYNQTYYPAASKAPPPTPSFAESSPLPIYFRLHPHSTTPFPTKTMWLSILQHPNLAEISSLATREHPGTQVLKLEGLVTYKGDQGDREVTVEVADDAELGAYLGHVKSAQAQGKATFVVLLGGYV